MHDDQIANAWAPARRGFVLALAASGASVAVSAQASAGALDPEGELLDRLRVAELVQRERAARDAAQWDEMAACYAPGSVVDVSWYHGDGAGFVAGTRRVFAAGRLSQHQLGPTVARIAGQRAIAETPCQLLSFVVVGGVDACVMGTVRLLWRARKAEGRWLIDGLRMIYIRDLLIPCDPSRAPAIDQAALARFRPAYRFLSYILAQSPNPPRDDLPGIDRPETVTALRAAEAGWLAGH